MTPALFEQHYGEQWARLEALLVQIQPNTRKKRKPAPGAAADESPAVDEAELPALYRQASQHLALARDRGYPPYLVARLNRLVLDAHQAIYRPRLRAWDAIKRFVVIEFPQLVRDDWRLFWLAALAFYGPAIALGLMVYFNAELVYAIFDPYQVAQYERMYRPGSLHIGREREAGGDFLMFGVYIKNNIGIAFQVFASGLFAGIGSLFYLIMNGVFIGGTAGYLTQLGYTSTFWPFVSGHGSFELTGIVISGMAGLKLGLSFLAPGNKTRKQALIDAARIAVRLIYGVTGMLFIAAVIEAFWSSSTWIGPQVKYVVGATLWALVIYYLVWQGRSRAR